MKFEAKFKWFGQSSTNISAKRNLPFSFLIWTCTIRCKPKEKALPLSSIKMCACLMRHNVTNATLYIKCKEGKVGHVCDKMSVF